MWLDKLATDERGILIFARSKIFVLEISLQASLYLKFREFCLNVYLDYCRCLCNILIHISSSY